jgi:hypothetical protein
MRKSGDTERETGFESGDSKLAVDDVDRLIFQKRVATVGGSNRAPSSQLIWIGLAVIGAFVFVLLVRALLDGTSSTAGSSAESATASEPSSRDRSSAVPMPFAGQESQTRASIRANPQVHMVYRCVGKGGAVSLQSQPCSPDQNETRAIYAPPEVERVRRPTIVSSVPIQTSRYSSGPSAEDYERDRRLGACAYAKSNREATLARVGLKRTYDLLQRLDAMVYEACKGQ